MTTALQATTTNVDHPQIPSAPIASSTSPKQVADYLKYCDRSAAATADNPAASARYRSYNPPIMVKPVVSAMNAWTCIVVSLFAIVILSTIGALFKGHSGTVMGGHEDPEDGGAVAGAVFGAVFIYIGFFVFCGLQAFLHMRESRRGAISLS
ncbi:hypothetical protein ACET3X_008237 [Alternaria dauci]